jgi:hypothetical protein
MSRSCHISNAVRLAEVKQTGHNRYQSTACASNHAAARTGAICRPSKNSHALPARPLPSPSSCLVKATDICVMHLLHQLALLPGLDMVAGSTAYSWGIGRQPSSAQVERFRKRCSELCSAVEHCGGPYLCGPQPSLVSDGQGLIVMCRGGCPIPS